MDAVEREIEAEEVGGKMVMENLASGLLIGS